MNDSRRSYLSGQVTISEFPTIPAGTYEAALDGLTEVEHELYGTRWVWHWSVPDAHPDGGDFELQVWSPPRLSSSGIAIEQAKALGITPAVGARIDLGSLQGRRAQLVVTVDEERGRNRVKAVMPIGGGTRHAGVDRDYADHVAEREAQEAVLAAATPPKSPSSAPEATERFDKR